MVFHYIKIDESGLVTSIYEIEAPLDESPRFIKISADDFNLLTAARNYDWFFRNGDLTRSATPNFDLNPGRDRAKLNRQAAVDAIIVEVDGMLFDGDEVSQERMARSIVALEATETITWILADNSSAEVTPTQLRSALRMAGAVQAQLWLTASGTEL